MKSKFLLLPFLFVFLCVSTTLFSQSITNSNSFKKIFSGDSLVGFDEEAVKLAGIAEGLYGDSFKTLLEIKKRAFINSKYGLDEQSFNNFGLPNTNISGYSLKTIGGPNFINNAPCNNEDFEIGNLSGWSAATGTNSGSQIYPLTPNVITMGAQATVVSTPLVDPVTGITIPNSPLGGTKVAKINNTSANYLVVKLSQTFSVTPTNYLYDFAYWAVMQDAANHNCANTPYMLVKIRNFTGTLQACPNFSIVAPSSGPGGCAGIGPSTWTTVSGSIKTNNSWQKFSIDLTAYMSQNVTVEVIVSACGFSGHYGYAYFDSNCNTMNLTVNNTQTLSMPSTTVSPQVICGSNATLSAPSGLGPYSWTGPAGSGITSNTNQAIVTSVAGNYTLNMSPSGICNPPIQKIVALSFVPPTTVTASPAVGICTSGSNTVATLTAAGATSYTWSTGSNSPTIAVSPTVTTVYTVTAKTGTCTGNFTVQVTVNPNPNVTITNSSPTVCTAASATLLANGASTYSWSTGSSSNPITVTPTTITTYTVIGTSTAGCVGIASTSVAVSGVPTPTLFNISVPSTICVGGAVTCVAAGPYTFNWQPGGAVGAVVSLSPTVTTTYTVIASAGSCTNTANITVTVDPGPTMTVTSTPTIICPGNTATLSSIAPTATGFTWTPGGLNTSSITVSPVTTTNYSVTGINSNGCKSTYTLNQVVSPVPNITITPSSPSLCIGSTLTLTASGGSTYTWNPGNILNANAVVNPTINTTYTVIASNGVCTSSLSTLVSVVPVPSLSVTASPTSICNGSSANLSASGATSYTWLPGGLTGGNVSVSPSLNTTYTVTGSSGGCSNTKTIFLIVKPSPTISAIANQTAVCPGFCSTITPLGAATYTINGGSFVVCPTLTTTYSITGTSSLGCVSANPATLTVISNPTPSLLLSASSPSICRGNSATLTANGAVSYTWLPGGLNGANVTVNPTVSTTYTVSGISASGCLGQNTIALIVVPVPTINVSASSASICNGSSTSLTATGGCTYTWMPGSLVGSNISVTPTVTTTYTVSSACSGCPSSTFITITVINGPTLIASASPTSICPGGSAILNVSGGTTYTWNPGSAFTSTLLVNPLTTTIYTVVGKNASGCSSTRTLNLVVNPSPTINVNPSSFTICPGGSASLSANGATSYTWLPGNLNGSNVSVTPAISTIFTVNATNASGCVGQNTVSVVVLSAPSLTVAKSSGTICAGSCATLTASGATNYTWLPMNSNGITAVVCPTLSSTYTLVGSNAFGCVNSTTTSIMVNSIPNVVVSSTPASVCSGNTATLTATGATSYTWQPGNLFGSSITVTPLSSTVYTATGINAAGCQDTTSHLLVVNPQASITVSQSSFTICSGATVTLSANGGTSYTWTPGNLFGSSVSVSPTVTTIYTVTGTNGSGCSGQNTVVVNVLSIPSVSASSTSSLICSGQCATLTATGASNYTWNPGGMTGSVVVVCPLVPTLYQAGGSNGVCSSSANVVIIVNTVPNITVATTPSLICSGASASLTASGANTYTWLPVSLTGSLVNVSPVSSTIYTVIGTNLAGCTSSATINVSVSPLPSLTISPSSFTICSGGFVVLNAGGANSYTWNPGGTFGSTLAASPTITTVYTVTGNNPTGCNSQNTATVFVTPVPSITLTSSPSAICAGGCSTLNASGAASYTWNIGSTGSSANVCPTVTTTYSVVGSSGGCSGFASITVSVNNIPSVNISSTSSSICAGSSATLTGSGTLTYTWSPGLSNNTVIVVSPTSTTVYSLTGSNGTGCSNSTTFTLSVVPNPTINAVASSNSVCAGFTTALSATGANSYTWNPSGATGSLTIETPTINTTYTVVGESNGCTATSTLSVNVVPLPIITANAVPPNVCAGFSTAITANGAVTYTWLPSLVPGQTFTDTPLTTTTYTVAGIAASGCPNFTTVTVLVLPTPTVSIAATTTALCIGSSATLNANGAASYTWMPGSLTSTNIVINPTLTSSYTLTGDNGGCTDTKVITINVNPLPIVSAAISNSIVCAGSAVNLSALGAVNYTWNPLGSFGANVSDNPFTSQTYTVIGEDANGCANQATVDVSVNPTPTIVAFASPNSICEGAITTLTASGALTFTWNPTGQNTALITDTPLSTTIYTVSGTDAIGCVGSETVLVTVVPNPTLSVSPLNSTVCAGSSVTLTANGATNYTWFPSNTNSSLTVENPLVNTTYTVVGDNGGICSSSLTVDVFVTPLPANVVATSIGTISCASPTVALTGSSTDTDVIYNWSGPLSYNSTQQNPTVTIWGNFTLSVTNTITGCTASVVINVPTDNSIPSVTATTSGSITCSVETVTISAVNTTTNPSYNWSGPNGFTSTNPSFTTNLVGVYSVTITDLSSSCSATAVVSVNIHTNVPITATITPATCTGTMSNNDGTILVANFGVLDKYDLVSGSTYTGTTTYTNATIIPSSSVITSNLANPTTTLAYTIRFFDVEGCYKDTTLILTPTDCSLKSFGIAKAVSNSGVNADGTYDVTYTVIVKNYDTSPLSNVLLTENLANTFPSPSTFTLTSQPINTQTIGGLVLNSGFDGVNQTSLSDPLLSTLLAGESDTLIFTLKLSANGFFGPFNNSIIGFATNSNSVAVSDSSNTGLDPDPDNDSNPNNNNTPTSLTLTPNVFFGITKVGEVSSKLDDNSFDVSYVISIHNLGNDTLYNIVLKDSLFEKAIKSPAKYVIKSAPIANDSLTANIGFDGKSDINLLDPANSKMPPGFVSNVRFVINVSPDTVHTIKNSAYGSAVSFDNVVASDTSNAGTNPDSNGNGIWNEPVDNLPTVLALDNYTLFIPQGFTPNGDSKNDLFVIKGLPSAGENNFTVFNRWGNKVYTNSNYDNSWNGMPNVGGALGGNKLPQGTYFFLLDMKGSGIKPITGYIVIQY